MDLFETLGSAIIGDIDLARERADSRAVHELHKADNSEIGRASCRERV